MRERNFAQLLSFAAVTLVLGETYAFMEGYGFAQAHPDFVEALPAVGELKCKFLVRSVADSNEYDTHPTERKFN